MAVITISRQYGSGGDEIAARVCEILDYQYFDKRIMAQVATEVGLSKSEIVDFSEDHYKMPGFLERLFGRRSPRVVARVRIWREETNGARVEQIETLDEAKSITLVQSTVQAAYRRGNIVIVGRGGQAILKDKPDVLHVRIEAPLDIRNQRIYDQENASMAGAQDSAVNHDRAAADYLRRFYGIDWAAPMLYDLVINTGKLSLEAAAQLIVKAISYLPVAQSAQ
jgi:cytidylate kinase